MEFCVHSKGEEAFTNFTPSVDIMSITPKVTAAKFPFLHALKSLIFTISNLSVLCVL